MRLPDLTSPHRPRRGSRRSQARIAVIVALVLSGCALGTRPTLQDPPLGGVSGSKTGDAAVDAVLTWLEAPQREPFTARFDLVQKSNGASSIAVVTQDGTGRRAATIGPVRFLWLDGTTQTCDLPTGTCEQGILDARTSDTGFTSGVDAVAPARRLRIAATRAIAPTTSRTETIAGLTATCVDVPLTATVVETYCALQQGVVARWDAADLHLEITEIEAQPTESEFSTQA